MKNTTKLGLIALTGLFGAASVAAASPSRIISPRPAARPAPLKLPGQIRPAEKPNVRPFLIADRPRPPRVVPVKKRPLPKISKKSRWFMKLDGNADGVVSFVELQRGTPYDAKHLFRRLDANHDGRVSARELGLRTKKARKFDRDGRVKNEAKKKRR